MEPPSASDSLLDDELEGVGEGVLEDTGEGSLLMLADFTAPFPLTRVFTESFPLAFASLPAAVKVARFPVPNLLQG